jgi:hypothetical protein
VPNTQYININAYIIVYVLHSMSNTSHSKGNVKKGIAVKEITGKEKSYTLDTCVIIKICENPNIGNLLNCRINFEDSKIFLNSQSLFEAKKYGFNYDYVYQTLKKSFDAKIEYEEISENLKNYAIILENLHSSLHPGDSEILAFAESKHSVLLSCDKALLIAAGRAGVKFINPDILPCHLINKKSKMLKKLKNKTISSISTNIKLVENRITSTNQKNKGPKAVKKITWSTFV